MSVSFPVFVVLGDLDTGIKVVGCQSIQRRAVGVLFFSSFLSILGRRGRRNSNFLIRRVYDQ